MNNDTRAVSRACVTVALLALTLNLCQLLLQFRYLEAALVQLGFFCVVCDIRLAICTGHMIIVLKNPALVVFLFLINN